MEDFRSTSQGIASKFAEQLLRPLEEVCSGMKAKLSGGGDGGTPFILYGKQWDLLVDFFSLHLDVVKGNLEVMLTPFIASLRSLFAAMEAARKSFEECIAPHARGYLRYGSSSGGGAEEEEYVWTGPKLGGAEEEEEEEEEERKRRREDVRVWMAKHALRHILDDEVPHRHADNFRTASVPVFIHLRGKDDIKTTRKWQATMSNQRDSREARAFFRHEEMARIDISQLLLCRLRDDENAEAPMEPLFVDRAQFRKCKDDDSGSGYLGEGGFGSVKLRKWISDDHYVAVKKGELGRQEIEIQARVRHPNLLPLFCCCTAKRTAGRGGKEEMLFLPVMERMDSSLENLITSPLLQSFILHVEMMLQIAKGMEYLHSLDIIHRDLKPPNILVSGYLETLRFAEPYLPCAFLRVKVADFGVSKMNFQTCDSSNTLKVGSGFYRAPEVLEGYSGSRRKWRIGQSSRSDGYSRKADVYSFAMVCYFMLTGKEPFHGDSRPEYVLRQKIRDEALRPKLDFECWAASLVGMVEDCWHRDASKRPEFVEIVKFLRFVKTRALLFHTNFLLSCKLIDAPDKLLETEKLFLELSDAIKRKELFREFRHMGSDAVESL